MKIKSKRLLSLLLTLCMALTLLPATASAAEEDKINLTLSLYAPIVGEPIIQDDSIGEQDGPSTVISVPEGAAYNVLKYLQNNAGGWFTKGDDGKPGTQYSSGTSDFEKGKTYMYVVIVENFHKTSPWEVRLSTEIMTYDGMAEKDSGDTAGRWRVWFELTPFIPPEITTETLPDGEVGQSYNAKVEAEGDDTITWSLAADNELPPGLSLDSSTGVISGTPEKSGDYRFNVIANNAALNRSDQKEFTVAVSGTVLTLVTAYKTDGGGKPLAEAVLRMTEQTAAGSGRVYEARSNANGEAHLTWKTAATFCRSMPRPRAMSPRRLPTPFG